MDVMLQIQPWHWLAFAILLLISEVLGAGGFLIGLAIAAFIQSLVAVNFPQLPWDMQLVIFAFNSLMFTVFYWRFFKGFNNKTDAPMINDRASQYVDRVFELHEPILHGEGKIKIGDTLWRIRADEELEKGVSVKVIDSDGMVLIVEKVS